MKVTKGSILKYLRGKEGNTYVFKFPDIKEMLSVEIMGQFSYFDEKIPVGSEKMGKVEIHRMVIEEVKRAAYKAYKQYGKPKGTSK